MTQHTTDEQTNRIRAKEEQKRRLAHNIYPHTLATAEAGAAINRIRRHAEILGQVVIDMTPTTREQSLALTRLEEVVFWAIAAIARNQTGLTDSQPPV